MNDLTSYLRRAFRAALFFMSGCLILYAFIPSVRPVALGLVIGTAASLANAWHLGMKTERLTRNLVEKTGKRVSLGFVTRICIALLAVMVAYKEPGIDLVSTVIGLFFVQSVTLLGGILSVFHKS